MIQIIRSVLKTARRFSKETDGTVSVEAVIVLPMLLWAFIAMWVFFDAYKTRSETEKAAFVVSDMLARETGAINETFMVSAKNLFDILADSDSESGLRTSVISYRGKRDIYVLEWSNAQGNISALSSSSIAEIATDLPEMVDGETLILVETISTYEPSLNVGLGDLTMKTFIFARPRFAPQLVWERGLGNI
ncbi:pilus assembly protein [uncultured Shimia sp.]|uniref:TadE/TadG family type IV pilus assembly protein n=1 Tax=uncultured Shimia sp. TaxID=573152 RepID=UPI0026142F8B|nr:pilus assembly protein [uncultured Shimia sp.]